MTEKYCDLHLHSTASDGTDAPEALGELAQAAGLSAIALTDHDTTEGLAAAAAGCEQAGVDFVPGIEISADPFAVLPGKRDEPANLGTLHILGLFVRDDDEQLLVIHERMKHARDSRNPAIVTRLQELGMRIEYEEVTTLAVEQGTRIIGRPHIAQVLQGKGYVKTVHDAFVKYIGQGGPAYVRRDRLEPDKAIEAIHHAGGLAIMAHPTQLKAPDDEILELFIKRMKDLGLDGIETIHSDHRASDVTKFEKLAQKYQLLASGGSDYHGKRKKLDMGSQRVGYGVYEKLKSMVEKK